MTQNPNHDHQGFPVPDGDPLGRPVDARLLGDLIGAAFDGCTTCQDPLLTLMTEDSATTARMIELACVATSSVLGGIPASMTDEGVPGEASPEFRQLAKAGVDGNNEAMFAVCDQMDPTQRRAAANTAADLLIGHLSMGGI